MSKLLTCSTTHWSAGPIAAGGHSKHGWRFASGVRLQEGRAWRSEGQTTNPSPAVERFELVRKLRQGREVELELCGESGTGTRNPGMEPAPRPQKRACERTRRRQRGSSGSH